MPLTIGRWEAKTVQDKSVQQVFGDSHSYLLRRYLNQSDGTAATMMADARALPGPMLIQAFTHRVLPQFRLRVSGATEALYFPKVQDNGQSDEFWVATFKKTTDAIPMVVRVYWSWTATGGVASTLSVHVSRSQKRYPMLYKLYVIQNIANENAPFDGAPVHDLIKELTNG